RHWISGNSMKEKTNYVSWTAALVGVAGTLIWPSFAAAELWAEKPLATVETLAQQGDVRAERELCLRYGKGLGVKEDLEVAHAWCSQAAEKGDPVAMRNMGLFYLNGDVVGEDEELAVEWFRKAAEKGEGRAQYN